MPMARKIVSTGIHYVIMMVVAVIFLFPFYWAFVLGVAHKSQVFTIPPVLWPSFDWHPFLRAWAAQPWVLYFFHSVIITGVTIVFVVITGLLGGFSLALVKFPGREVVFGILLASLMVPFEAILIPDYVVTYNLHLTNTLTGQILPYAANVFAIFLFRQFFKSLPQSLWDAIKLEGGTWWHFLWRIALPLTRPAMASVVLLTFTSQWSSFQWPIIITQGVSARPIEVGLSFFQGFDGNHWREVSGASLMTLIPIIIVFFFTQKYLIASVSGRSEEY